jgi:hypothetical protein
MRSSHHSLILALGILLTLGILGWRMLQPPAPVALEQVADVAEFSNRITQAVARIERIDLSQVAASIQNDPSYQTLVDFSKPLPVIPPGRENPFAPFEKTPRPPAGALTL